MSSAVHEKPTQLSYLNSDADPIDEPGHRASAGQEDGPELRGGVSVHLATRALYLLEALNLYSDASSKQGFAIAAVYNPDIQSRFSPHARSAIIAREKGITAQGNESFRRAWGVETMADAGVDTVTLNYYAGMDREDFTRSLVGPGNKRRRAKYREKLQQHIDRLNND